MLWAIEEDSDLIGRRTQTTPGPRRLLAEPSIIVQCKMLKGHDREGALLLLDNEELYEVDQ